MNGMVSGALLTCYLIAGVFFLRFWTTTRDRLFLMFAAAFGVLAIQRFALTMTRGSEMEDQTVFYLIRLAAFVIIAIAIVDKNRR